MEGMHEEAGRERPDVRPGDSTAGITAFFDAALDVVHPYLSRRCAGDRALAEDLTQETFVVAVRTLLDRGSGVSASFGSDGVSSGGDWSAEPERNGGRGPPDSTRRSRWRRRGELGSMLGRCPGR